MIMLALGARVRGTAQQGADVTDHDAAVKMAKAMVKVYAPTSKQGKAWRAYLADLTAPPS